MGGGRKHYLDALKCLGIILVVRGHVQLYGFGQETYSSLPSLMFYTFNMPIFFFISGLFAYKEISDSQAIVRRLSEKFVFLVVPALCFMFFRSVCLHESPTSILFSGFGEYWFTFTLFECFLLLYFIQVLIKHKFCISLILALISVGGIIYLSIFSKYEIPLLDFNRLSKYFQFFACGIVVKLYFPKVCGLIKCDWLIGVVTILFFICLVATSYEFIPSPINHLNRDVVLRYLGTFMVLVYFYRHKEIFDTQSKVNNLIAQIGKYSLPIYLLQYFFIPDFKEFSTFIEGLDVVTLNVICFIYTAIIIAICLLFVRLLSNSYFIRRYLFNQK